MIDVEEFLTLRDLFNEELSISEIARQTGHSRVTVRKYLNSQVPPLPQKRSKKQSKLDGHREYIIGRLKENPLSASRIYREIQDRGFTGKYTIVKPDQRRRTTYNSFFTSSLVSSLNSSIIPIDLRDFEVFSDKLR